MVIVLILFQSANNRVFNSEPGEGQLEVFAIIVFQSANNRVFNSKDTVHFLEVGHYKVSIRYKSRLQFKDISFGWRSFLQVEFQSAISRVFNSKKGLGFTSSMTCQSFNPL